MLKFIRALRTVDTPILSRLFNLIQCRQFHAGTVYHMISLRRNHTAGSGICRSRYF